MIGGAASCGEGVFPRSGYSPAAVAAQNVIPAAR